MPIDPLSELTDPNRAALNNPRVRTFLDKISQSEGADYDTLVGGKRIKDLSRHPNIVGLTTKAGPSTAFGRYQITHSTHKSKLAKYADLDYSPENQDVRAVELLRQTGALKALEGDDEPTAVKLAGKEWASLPGSSLPGRKNYAAFKEQDPLTELTKSQKIAPRADPLTVLTSQPKAEPIGRGAAMARAQPMKPIQRRQVSPASIPFIGSALRGRQAIKRLPTRADVMRAEEQPVPSRGTYDVDPRLAKGEQPEDPMAYAKAQELVGRVEPRRTETTRPVGPRAFEPRRRSLAEMIPDAVRDLVPGIASIDTPGGIKTDAIRSAINSLNVIPGPQAEIIRSVSQPREVLPEEKILNPNAEADKATREYAGAASTAFIPYIAAGKAAGLINNPIVRDAVTFGIVELGRQMSSGKEIDPQALAESILMGGSMGKIVGADPSLKRRLAGYIAPALAVGIAKGEKPEQLIETAVTNGLFAAYGGKKEVKPEINLQPRTALREGQNEIPNRTPDRQITSAGQTAPQVEGQQVPRPASGGLPSADLPLPARTNMVVSPIKRERITRETQTETQPNVETQLEGAKFETGKPVTIPFTRNTEGASQYRPDYKEQVPGRYMVERPEVYQPPDARWEQGEVAFKNPLVVESRSDDPGSPENWKNQLSARYGKSGKELSEVLRKEGYDGIITYDKYGTGEIVDLQTPRHVDLQPRRVRGEGKGQFKSETRAQREERLAKVEQGAIPPSAESAVLSPEPSVEGATTQASAPSSPREFAASPAREPWQMSQEEFTAERRRQGLSLTSKGVSRADQWLRKELVKQALSEGKPVPPEVLKDYPNLAPPAEPSTTSARKEQFKVDRSELDLPELSQPERKAWQTSLDNAKEKRLDRKADLLADEITRRPRALNDEETAGLVLRAQELKNEHARLMGEIGKAETPEQINDLRAQLDPIESQFDKITAAAKKSGTEKGRALASQKLTINQDYDLVSMVNRAKVAKGRDLTADERTRYESQAKQIADLESQLATANEKAKTASLQKSIDRVKRQTRRQETKQVLDDEFASLKAQLAQAKIETRSGVQGSLLAGLDPEGKLTPIIAKMAKNRVRAGINSAEALVTEVYNSVKDHYDVSKDDVARLIRGTLHEPDDVLSRWDKARQGQLLKQEVETVRRLNEGDFTKPQRERPIYNRETARLQRRVDEIKHQYNRELYRATRSTGGRISDELAKAANVPKTIKSMGDISAVFRQGGYYAITHPIRGGALPFGDMVRSFTDAGYRNVESAIKSHPKFEQARRDGVEFTGVDKSDPHLSKHEEGYLGSEYLDYVPVAKQIKDFSERTFVSFLDSQRMNIYDTLTEGLTNPSAVSRLLGAKEGLNREQLAADRKRIGKVINSATGRGNLGAKGNQAAPLLNIAMFSPRLLKSRVELLNNMFNPVAVARMPRNARAEIVKDNAKFLAATVATLSLARALGAQVSTDPDDSDFLKIRIGETTYDNLTGLQQPLRYILNMSRAIKADVTGDETYTGRSKGELTKQFARSKLSPLAGSAVNYLSGSDMLGRQFSLKREAGDIVTPLPARDFYDAMKREGLLVGAIKATPTLIGIGVQTYPVNPEKPKTQGEKLARKIIRDSMPDEARTDEEIEKSQNISDLRARARRGEDVSSQLKALNLTERQSDAILSSRGRARLQEDYKKLSLKDAIRVWGTLSQAERDSVKDILETKSQSVVALPADEQAVMRKKLESLGMKIGLPVKKVQPREPRKPRQPKQGYVFQ